ncbi:MAG TPA: 3-hydroxyacyl-CoA dehydrogenase NAD-binding domain-containing protein [Solirubrobacterales bacterium]|nr:3-hydroxyacyl-CoA dehydrogenase NAD-binding domain-containing protein [Solirubrobacterales bacterium]
MAGSGAIACGVAACATALGEVRLLARSDQSAWRAEERIEQLCAKVEGGDSGNARVTTDVAELAGCDLVVEAIAEQVEAKVALHSTLAESCPDADLATTTSSLGISDLASRIGEPGRFYGLHVFNPVIKMELIELCLPDQLDDGVGERARAFCDALGKRAVDVPDEPGFAVNRLLFPFLFDAVRLLERTAMPPEDIDACMTLGTGQPMGPLKLLDFVGIDVAAAIGDSLHADSGEPAHRPPGRLITMVGDGHLGRKAGRGFYTY